LKNPVYAGRIELPKWRISRAGDWEPIVSRELFARVQSRRQYRGRGNSHKRLHPDFPLRVFVRCGRCQTPLTGSWSRGRNARYAYYSCRKGRCVRVGRERLESLFVERLRALQPDPDYLRLFNAIVRDVWREQQTEARRLREETQRNLEAVSRRLDQLESAFIYDKRVDRETYERQRDKLREESALLELRLHDTRIDELDIDALLAFAEHVVGDAAWIWSEANLEQRIQLQQVFFPRGLEFDGARFGTAATCLAFREIGETFGVENGLASPTGTVVSYQPVFRGEWLDMRRVA
jgi:hypothetical protein